MSFGAGPFGAMPFGAGSPASLLLAEQITRNSIRITFSGPVAMRNRGDVHDALYDRGWSLEALSDATAHVPRVIWIDPDPDVADSVILRCDSVITPFVVYRVTVSGLILTGATTIRFGSFGQLAVPTGFESRSFDLANRPSGDFEPGEPLPLGTFSLSSDGDLANDEGLENLRKRCVRRLTTRRGAFGHLPNYGLDLPLKAPFRPSLLRQIQADAIEQLRSEPGVLEAAVQLQVPAPGILRISARVTANSGAIGVRVSVPIPVV